MTPKANVEMEPHDQKSWLELKALIRDFRIAEATYEAINDHDCELEFALGHTSTPEEAAMHDAASKRFNELFDRIIGFWSYAKHTREAHQEFMRSRPDLISAACELANGYIEQKGKAA